MSPSRDFVARGRRFATPCASLRDAWLASLANRGRLGASLAIDLPEMTEIRTYELLVSCQNTFNLITSQKTVLNVRTA